MKNEYQKVEQAKGRPLLQWVGKKPLESVQFYPAQETEVYGDKNSKGFNKLFWGDNLQVLSHLLKEYRGKLDLIYIDPPFDSKADYVKRVKVRGEKVTGQQQSLLEEKQYTDIWENDEYLQFMYERLLLMRELLSDSGSFYLHCDWHKQHQLRCIMDEVFGPNNFVNEIIWKRSDSHNDAGTFSVVDDRLLLYKKGSEFTFNTQYLPLKKEVIDAWYNNVDSRGERYKLQDTTAPGGRGPVYSWHGITRAWRYKKEVMEKLEREGRLYHTSSGYPKKIVYLKESKGVPLNTIWSDLRQINRTSNERTEYPTQKPIELLKRIILSSSNKGDLIADFFVGSGTTLAAAQQLGRRWVGCDINIGAIQTTTKQLNNIIFEQQKEVREKFPSSDFKGLLSFKVCNVNDYDVFKNELEAKEIIMEMYGVEPIKRSYFDGILDKNFVKVMPMNRVLNKMDIRTLLKNVGDKLEAFTVKAKSNVSDAVYEEGVLIICSGMELDALDFVKKENKTGVKIEIRDVTTDKKNLIFKKKPEAKIEVKAKNKKLIVELKDFYSPILMRKLEIENEKVLTKAHKAKVGDFKQIIDSVAIDADYNGKLFNAEVMDLPEKNGIIKAKYEWEYSKRGKYTIAVKVIDVLGEEYFETFEVNA